MFLRATSNHLIHKLPAEELDQYGNLELMLFQNRAFNCALSGNLSIQQYSEVTSPFMIAGSLCIGCMACAAVCPTGVIEFVIEKEKLKKKDWGVALDMIFCPDCGQPVGTSIQMKQLKENISVTDEFLNYCPACRRKKNYSVKTVYSNTGV